MSRVAQIAAVIVFGMALAVLSLLIWGWSDPEGCVSGRDPAVALANERAGAQGTYRDWCHESDGNSLHVVEAGKGETILFIHGFPSIWYSMIRPMEDLREDYRVVAIDGLGAGLSDAPDDIAPYRLAAMADHLDALAEDLGAERFHLVGHDWGAAFAFAYAQSRPEKLLSVTGISAPPQNVAVEMLEISDRQREISQYVERLKSANPPLMLLSGAGERIASGPENHLAAGRMTADEAGVLKAATSDLRRINRHINWYRANLPTPDRIEAEDYWPGRDAKLSVPALLIWGEEDTVFDPAFIDVLRGKSDNLDVLSLEGVGHAPQFEAVIEVNSAIRQIVMQNPREAEPPIE
ncbi:MAG: alpha/beta hydrolase [Erythrobacter sp.]|nr:alpha/beta hydrolase [Erythrobacter sp.]